MILTCLPPGFNGVFPPAQPGNWQPAVLTVQKKCDNEPVPPLWPTRKDSTAVNTIDLHLHTTASTDADFSPAELLSRCAAAGLRAVSITDHNSTRAYPAAFAAARRLGLTLIPGVELDCHLAGVNLHLLGYAIDPSHPAFDRYEAALVEQEQRASAHRLAAVRALGIRIEDGPIQALAVHGIITGEMLAEVALSDPRNAAHPLLDPYRPGGARSANPYVNFYWDICSQGQPAYAHVEFIPLAAAVDMIHAAGGFAVLAHPAVNIGLDSGRLRQVVSAGARGVEAYTTYHDPAAVQFYVDQARALSILVTIGSDFHGKTKPAIRLGQFTVPGEPQIQQAFFDLAAPKA